VQVRSADTCRFNLNNYVVITASWALDFADFNAVGFG
jgi:hypothetical protein